MLEARAAGARCARHEAADAVAGCPRCGDNACSACWDRDEGLCLACRVEHGAYHAPLESHLTGIVATLRDVLRTPEKVFARLAPRGHPLGALLVAALVWSTPVLGVVVTGMARSEDPFDALTLVMLAEVAAIGGAYGMLVALLQGATLWVASAAWQRRSFGMCLRAAGYGQAAVVAVGVSFLVLGFLPRIAIVLPLFALPVFAHHQANAFGHFLRGPHGPPVAPRVTGAALAIGWLVLEITLLMATR